MKNTILKMAGVKDEKSFYKKYPTEAAFLKANPKFALGGKMNIQAMQKFEFGGNEEIITPTIEANRQTYPKTITYSPQEWHQKNILAGNVMLGKNNDLNTMFKNNIYPQYTLPNDTVPINYSPVVKQLPMPKGFVDNSKSTFNYAAGQQLLKQANGGQINFQAMPQFANGGVNSNYNAYAAGAGMAVNAGMATNDAIKLNDASNEDYRREDNKDLSGQIGAAGVGAASGALTGASIGASAAGATFGLSVPVGAAIGAVVGGTSSFFKKRSADKKEWKAEQEAENQQMISQQNAAMYAPQQVQQPQQIQKISSYANPNQQMFGKYGGQIPMAVAKYGGMYNMGGIQQYAMGGFGDPTDPPISAKIINNAQKVSTVPSNYNKIGSQDNRTYYDVASDKAKSNPLGNGTGPNPGWEQSIIKRLQSGTSAQSLADAGHISSSQIEKYNQYYKPLYTETQPTNTTKINTQIPLADENKIDRKQVFSGSPYNTFQYPDSTGGYAKATTRHFDPKTNKEIDAFKSFDSEGNYAPLYLNNSSEGIQGTLKQTRINTPINSPVDSIPVNTGNSGFKYGGQMQYAMGGMNVQPNAEIELTEGTKDGYSIRSHDLNSHENATEANDVFLKGGSKVLSTRLIDPDTKEPFSNSTIDTKKYEKTINDPKASPLSKETAAKMINVAGIIFDKSFAKQELLKQQMASSAFDRMVKKYGLPPQLKNAQPTQYNEQMPQGMPGQSQGEMAIGKHGGMMNYMAMGGIQESDYQTDPGNLPSLLRQKRANDAALLGIRSSFGPKDDTNNVKDNLVVTLNKAKNYGKELADKIKNHPDNKKIEPFAMGGKLPMYYMGGDNDPEPDQPYTGSNYKDFDMQETNYFPQENYVQPQSTFNPYSVESWKFQQQLNKDRALYGNSAERISNQYTPAQNWNAQGLAGKINPNAGSPSGNTQGNLGVQGPPKIEGKGFDYKKAAGNLGQFALQNAGNIYDLGRSTQDNSKLNLSRVSPTFLDKTQDLQNNLRMYSEGKRQTAEASQGNASTYLNNMYANRASKLANDLNINTTYGNLNASIDNAAKLYNAGAIDKETMFKLQAEGMNRNLKGQALAGMSENFFNQRNSDRKDALDQQRLGIQKDFYKEYWANQDRENQRKVDEITKGKSNKNSWLDCSSGNCVERTSDQTQSTQSNPYYFSERQNDWNKIANDQQVKEKMDKLKKGKK